MSDARTRPHHLAGYFVGRSLLFALALLPRSLGRSAGRALGTLFYHASRRHRQVALANLSRAFAADRDERTRRRIARAAFAHMGEICADAAYFPRLLKTPTERLAVYDGVEHLQAAASCRRGVLVFSGHFGHWELIALLQHRLGHPMTMVARPLENPLFDRFLARQRERSGNRVISKRHAARGVLRALRNQLAVALLIDQNVRGDAGIFVEFFGVAASTTPSLATIAFKSGAPIVPVFSHPMPDGRIHIRYGPPIHARRSGQLASDIRALTQRCTRMLEDEIRQRPEYWLWMHNRWRTRPPEADVGTTDVNSERAGHISRSPAGVAPDEIRPS